MHVFMTAIALMVASPAIAQMPPLRPIAAPAEPGAIPLGTGGVPGGQSREQWFEIGGQRTVRNVTQATLTPVLPSPDKATGEAVIVAPGGGFLMLSMDNEGWPVARWLADRGIAAFVLKYRTKPTPIDDAGFGRAMGQLFSRPPLRAADRYDPTPAFAVEDAKAAMKLIKTRGQQWGVDPQRVGVLGFSAGAMTALQMVVGADAGERPAFVAPIYGPMNRVAVPANAPPLFAVLALDDPLFGSMGFGLVEAWREAGRSAELHAYQKGGHGFGLGKPGTAPAGWIELFRNWISQIDLQRSSK